MGHKTSVTLLASFHLTVRCTPSLRPCDRPCLRKHLHVCGDFSFVFWGKEEEKGTGARGAPVPVVGHGLKIKRAEFRSLESRPNEAHVNYW